MMQKRKKLLYIVLCSFLLSSMLVGCTDSPTTLRSYKENDVLSESDSYGGYADSNSNVGIKSNSQAIDEEDVNLDENGEIQKNQNAPSKETADKKVEAQKDIEAEKSTEKLVYTCDMSLETTEYKKTLSAIRKQIEKYHGIIDSQNERDSSINWYYDDYEKTSGTMECQFKIRIPSKDFYNFLDSIEGNGKVMNQSVNVENISRSYYDTKAVIESLKIQEDRLLEMMKKAENIKDMIEVEDRITEVQTELNQYKTQLSTMDTDVAYSTINMNVREVLEYKANEPGRKTNTFIERLKNTLTDSWRDFLALLERLLFAIIRFMPFLIVFGPLVYLFVHLALKSDKKAKQSLKNKTLKNDAKKDIAQTEEKKEEPKKEKPEEKKE